MKSIAEIEQILTTYTSGPIVPATAKELLAKYKALRTAYIAETDGQDPDEAEGRFLGKS